MVRAGPDSFLIDEFRETNMVAIGWNVGNLTDKSDEEIAELLKNKYGHIKALKQVLRFKNEIKVGDYVLSSNGETKTYFIGEITSDYHRSDVINEMDSSGDNYFDVREVKWIGEVSRDFLKKSTKTDLNKYDTVYIIEEDAKQDILKVCSDNKDSIENSARIIRNYLDENNLGNFEKKEHEEAYIKFRQSFSPEQLKNLSGVDILNYMFSHDGDKNNLCYHLEFDKDYNFAGSIAGGSAYKFGLFKHSKTNQWTTGSSRKSRNVSEAEAIEIGEKIRNAIVEGANLIRNFDSDSISDYMNLEIELGKIFSSCNTSHRNQWIHKYYVLIFPDKFPIVHWQDMKKDFLKIFNLTPYDWYYALDGQLQLLTKKSGIKGYSLFNNEILKLFDDGVKPPRPFLSSLKRNIIYFGAPGTGKSYNLNKDKDNLLENYENNYERVTFHPDYSYANFVGTYKPVPENDSITYKYVPGPFMRVLKKAMENPIEPYILIIEEINRANVAAVFGDVFQLLDRENNESLYSIGASEDMKAYINQDKIKIPQNMFIWATMNSADQGVFPMDTAFKRRWDFKYFSINNDEKLIENTKTTLNNMEVNWNDLRKAINDELLSYKINEDKLLGPFFAFNEFMNQEIPTETFKDIFKNKIIMYLFEDAARSKRNDLFQGAKANKKYVTYSQICKMFDESGLEIFCDNIKSRFIRDEEE